MNTKHKIEVMQAFLDGEQVERKSLTEGKWVNLPTIEEVKARPHLEPVWKFGEFEYRIKPPPLEFWTLVNRSQFPYLTHLTKYDEKPISRSANLVQVKFREVTE